MHFLALLKGIGQFAELDLRFNCSLLQRSKEIDVLVHGRRSTDSLKLYFARVIFFFKVSTFFSFCGKKYGKSSLLNVVVDTMWKFQDFLPLRFYVKSFLGDIRRSKNAISTIWELWILIFREFHIFKCQKFPKY